MGAMVGLSDGVGLASAAVVGVGLTIGAGSEGPRKVNVAAAISASTPSTTTAPMRRPAMFGWFWSRPSTGP